MAFGVTVGPAADQQQSLDLALRVEDRAPPDLGRVRSEHRADKGVGERVGEAGSALGIGGDLGERTGDRARSRPPALTAVLRAPAAYVDVLGDVGEQGGVAERPDQGKRVAHRQAAEHLAQPVHVGHGQPAGLVDVREGLGAGLLLDDLGEHGRQEGDVVPERRATFWVIV